MMFTVNNDGTTKRITNWEDLSEHERAVALRRIAKRNKQRLEILQQEQQQRDDSKEQGQS